MEILEGFPQISSIIIIIVVLFLISAIKIAKEYERLVVFRLGRLIAQKGPGLVIIIPIVDRAVNISLRIVTLDVPTQEVITRDNVTGSVNAVVYYRVVEPNRAVVNVADYRMATAQLAQTTLRSVAGQAELDELLSERDKLNNTIQQILDEATDAWGIKVTAVEIKDVVIPEGLQQAIARQAAAERERRAIVIQAEGEMQAAERLANAASILSSQEGGMFVRMLRTIPEIAHNAGNTIAFPLPMELKYLFESQLNPKDGSSEGQQKFSKGSLEEKDLEGGKEEKEEKGEEDTEEGEKEQNE